MTTSPDSSRRYFVLGGEEKKWKSILAPLVAFAKAQADFVTERLVTFVADRDETTAAVDDSSLRVALRDEGTCTVVRALFWRVCVLEFYSGRVSTNSETNDSACSFLWKPVVSDNGVVAHEEKLVALCPVLESCREAIVAALAQRSACADPSQQQQAPQQEAVTSVVLCNSHRGWMTVQNRLLTQRALDSVATVPRAFAVNDPENVEVADASASKSGAAAGWIVKSAAACVVSGSHNMLLVDDPSTLSRQVSAAAAAASVSTTTDDVVASPVIVKPAPLPWIVQERVAAPDGMLVLMKCFSLFGTLFLLPAHVNILSSSMPTWHHSKSFIAASCPLHDPAQQQPPRCIVVCNESSGDAVPLFGEASLTSLCPTCRGVVASRNVLAQMCAAMSAISARLELRLFGVDFVVDASASPPSTMTPFAVDVNAFPDFTGVPYEEEVLPRLLGRR
jgi:hypothetical protein